MKKWHIATAPVPPPEQSLAEELNISRPFLNLLWQRGLRDKKALDDYLDCGRYKLINPKHWPQVMEAAEFLASQLLQGKKLVVWGDYDVDGVTSTALVLEVLEFHGFEPGHHLPNRLEEGYGLNDFHIHRLADQGYNLLLTVDCGISNAAEIETARSRGFATVICDHHMPLPTLPRADRILDPRIGDESLWPCPNLAGVGASFYLMAAVNALLSPHTGKRFKMDDVLDLTALGTLSDIMLLTGQNRILVSGGLAVMNKSPRQGIIALKEKNKLRGRSPLTSEQTLFLLSPRLNAAGRKGDANLALELLRAQDFETASRLADELDECNRWRKTTEKEAFLEACAQIQSRYQTKGAVNDENLEGLPAALVAYGAHWHPGVLGIVAARLTEKFNRPAIALSSAGSGENGEELLKGSGRSWGEFDLQGALSSVSHLLAGFGGHKKAAGVTLLKKNLDAFANALAEFAQADASRASAESALELAGVLSLAMIQSPASVFLQELRLMEPFGPGNEEPLFCSELLTISDVSKFGADNAHVRLKVSNGAYSMKAKGMRLGHAFSNSDVNRQVRLAFAPRLEEYNGVVLPALYFFDWEFCDAKANSCSSRLSWQSDSLTG